MEVEYIGEYPDEDGHTQPLLVISNHPPNEWGNEQKKGCEIWYIPFPQIHPKISEKEFRELANEIIEEIEYWLDMYPLGLITIQGEYSLCAIIYNHFPLYHFVFPITERNIIDVMPDGTTTRRYVFHGWRELSFLEDEEEGCHE